MSLTTLQQPQEQRKKPQLLILDAFRQSFEPNYQRRGAPFTSPRSPWNWQNIFPAHTLLHLLQATSLINYWCVNLLVGKLCGQLAKTKTHAFKPFWAAWPNRSQVWTGGSSFKKQSRWPCSGKELKFDFTKDSTLPCVEGNHRMIPRYR